MLGWGAARKNISIQRDHPTVVECTKQSECSLVKVQSCSTTWMWFACTFNYVCVQLSCGDFCFLQKKIKIKVGLQDYKFKPLEDRFGLHKCSIVPDKYVYYGVLTVWDCMMDKVTFPLTLKAGTWTSIELQLAASLDYEIMQVFVEHLASQKLPILSTNGATKFLSSHHASNVDIATFIASYTHVILYKNAILPLRKGRIHGYFQHPLCLPFLASLPLISIKPVTLIFGQTKVLSMTLL